MRNIDTVEAELKHIHQVLQTIRRINQLINRETDTKKLIEKICDCLVETHGYYNAWIALFNKHGNIEEITSSSPDNKKSFLEKLINNNEKPYCQKIAINTDALVIIEDPAKECGNCQLIPRYHGRSVFIQRLSYNNQLYGSLSVSIPLTMAKKKQEQELFSEVIEDLSYALYNLSIKKKNQKSKIELEKSQKQINDIILNLADGIIVVNKNGKIQFSNPEAQKIFGCSKKELTGQFFGLASVLEEKTEVDIPRKKKEFLTVELRVKEIIWNHNRMNLISLRDITERKKMEKKVRSQLQYQQILREISESILTIKNTPELINSLCGEFTKLSGILASCIGICNQEKDNFDLFSCSGGDKEFQSIVKALYYSSEGKSLLLESGEKRPKEQIIKDIDNESDDTFWIKEAKKRGICSVISIPLFIENRLFGIITWFINKTDFINPDLLDFLRKCSFDISTGLNMIILSKELAVNYQRANKTIRDIVESFGRLTEDKDPYTTGHEKRVSKLSCAIGKELNLNEDQIEGIRTAAMLHDIGKNSVPSEILNKPTKLSDIEFSLITEHPKIAYNILKNIDFPWPVAEIVLQHHERINGSGYPNNLMGDDILFEAKILAVADVVEAMSSYRPYRPALGLDKALNEIKMNKGILYDSKITDICIRLFEEKNFNFIE